MFKRFFAVPAFIGALASASFADGWHYQIAVNKIYSGGFGVTGGRMYLECSNGKTYFINLSNSYANNMLAIALAAKTTGQKVTVWWVGSSDAAPELPMDRIMIN